MTTLNRNDTRGTAIVPPKVEDNTLDEQHAGIPVLTFPVTDTDQSSEGGQSHVARESGDDRKRRIAVAAYLRAEGRGFAPGADVDDWLAAERELEERKDGKLP
jgi:hypothetical protein